MVPLKDENPTSTTPYVTYALIAINIAVFFHQITLGPDVLAFVQTWGAIPSRITASLGGQTTDPVWITLFSSQFLHGGFWHIGSNMLYLWVFGNNIEDKLGPLKYLAFYLCCGALAALSQWFFFQDSNIPLVGASGAISGVMGAYIIRFPTARILTLFPIFLFITTIRVPAYLFLGFWFIQQALLSVASTVAVESGTGGVAYWAHAGGFVVGALLGPLLGLMDERPRRR